MKVFMIGGTGLLGSEGAKELISRGHGVRSVALPPVPEGAGLPAGMELVLANYLELSDDELRECFDGCEGFVFAAGVDERLEGPAPIYDMFYKYNIAPLKRLLPLAKEMGVRKIVILGSYFSWFEREWNDLKLYETHPYIRSRVDQERLALSFADDRTSVSVLELPYIFGTQPGRKPVWVFLVEMLKKMRLVTLYPGGGTTMVTVRQVGQCIAGALEQGVGGQAIPVGWYNLTWRQMLKIFHKHMGVPGKPILTIPRMLYRQGMKPLIRQNAEKGIQPGLDLIGLVEIMSRNAFIEKKHIQALGVTEDDIGAAIGESVELSLQILKGRSGVVDMKGE